MSTDNGQLLNGLLLVDKESGQTSHDVVAQARRIFGMRSIGHAGTLDPLADGLLVLLMGEATKISDYVLNEDKAYEVGVQLGLRTDTFDLDGQVLSQQSVEGIGLEHIAPIVKQLTGEFELAVPKYSAIKVSGKKLYDYARKDQDVVIPQRLMRFSPLEILSYEGTCLKVRMFCTKGTYVRSWVHEFGERLGCGATVATLRRIVSAPYKVEQALKLSEIARIWSSKDAARVTGHDEHCLGSAFIPLNQALPGFTALSVDGFDEKLLKNGQVSKGMQSQLLRFVGPQLPPGVRVMSQSTQDLLAILLAEEGHFYRIKRVFHNSKRFS